MAAVGEEAGVDLQHRITSALAPRPRAGSLCLTEVHTTPIFLSTVAIRLFASFLSNLLVTSFSSASTTPSLQRMPMAVPPFSTALTAYSTWKLRPSGEKTELERS